MYQEAANINWQIVAIVLPTVTAIVALIASQIFAYRLTKKQIISTVLSTERKEWTYALRLDVATFISQAIKLTWTANNLVVAANAESVRHAQELLGAVALTLSQINILLDRSKESHKTLGDALTKFLI